MNTYIERFQKLERYRCKSGMLKSSTGDAFGLFFIPFALGKTPLKVISAPFDSGSEWEHVSVSLPGRCPTWEEMCFVKNLFWSPEDCVVQFHPPESEYVNNAPTCLHLWKNNKHPTPTPPSILVGLK